MYRQSRMTEGEEAGTAAQCCCLQKEEWEQKMWERREAPGRVSVQRSENQRKEDRAKLRWVLGGAKKPSSLQVFTQCCGVLWASHTYVESTQYPYKASPLSVILQM